MNTLHSDLSVARNLAGWFKQHLGGWNVDGQDLNGGLEAMERTFAALEHTLEPVAVEVVDNAGEVAFQMGKLAFKTKDANPFIPDTPTFKKFEDGKESEAKLFKTAMAFG